MSSPPFVHLHCHSHYSLLDGASKIPDLVQRVKALGMPAVALTDHGNLYGAIELLREAKAAGILPIVGMEAYVAPGRRTERSLGGISGQEHAFHLTLLAKNAAGFRNLMRLSSLAFLEGFYYKPRIDKEILERHADGLICLSGCASAEFSDYILHGKTRPQAEQLCAWYQKIFGEENFYVEIQDNGVADPARLRRGGDRHRQADGPAAGRDQRRALPDPRGRRRARRARCASAPARRSTTRRGCGSRPRSSSSAARRRCTPRCPATRRPWPPRRGSPRWSSRITRASAWASAASPRSARPTSKTPEDYLRELCEAGLRDRYGDHPGPEVHDRLDHELGIINRMGFASYFLIVWDFVRYARERGIPALARGSACGALVSYVLDAEQRLPAQVRPAVRAVPRPQPLRGARHRHRPVPGAPVRGHRLRPEEVRRRQRRADRDLRHAQGQGGDQGRRPGDEHPAGPGRA